MPFKSKEQMRACFAKYNRDIKAGVVPKWDCYKWLEETPDEIKRGKSSPKRSSGSKRPPCGTRYSSKNPNAYSKNELVDIAVRSGYTKSQSSRMNMKELCKATSKSRSRGRTSVSKRSRGSREIPLDRKVRTGPRGGKYVIYQGRKIYV